MFEFPLLRRELIVEVLRTNRAIVIVVLAAGFSSAMSLLAWPSGLVPVNAAQKNVFSVLLFLETQLTAAILIVPAFTAGAIAGERERGTYELLHSTLLSPRSIVFSKALASAGFVPILLAAAAPMACALYLIGGVTLATILQCYAVTLASVILSGWICLFASIRSERTAGAVIKGMLLVIFWNVAVFAMAFSFVASHFGHDQVAITFSLAPHMAIFWSIVELPPFFLQRGPVLSRPLVEPWLGSVLYSSLLSALFLALLLRRARVPLTRGPWHGRYRSMADRIPKLKRRSLLTRLLVLFGERRVPLLRNPVFLKEIRSEFFGRTVYRNCVFWGALALFITYVSVVRSSRWHEKVHLVFTTALVLSVLIAPATAACAFTREIEQGNIDSLRGTVLGFRAILRGKLLAALYSVSGLVAAALVSCSFALVAIPGTCIHSVAILLITIVTAVSISLAVSAFSQRTAASLVGAYGLVLFWLAVWPGVLTLMKASSNVYIATNPLAALFALEWDAPSPKARVTALLVFHLIHGAGSLVIIFITGAYLELVRSRDR